MNREGCVVWLTGLPGSGKTTIARALEADLKDQELRAEVLEVWVKYSVEERIRRDPKGHY